MQILPELGREVAGLDAALLAPASRVRVQQMRMLLFALPADAAPLARRWLDPAHFADTDRPDREAVLEEIAIEIGLREYQARS